jgi:hypothetical protein
MELDAPCQILRRPCQPLWQWNVAAIEASGFMDADGTRVATICRSMRTYVVTEAGCRLYEGGRPPRAAALLGAPDVSRSPGLAAAHRCPGQHGARDPQHLRIHQGGRSRISPHPDLSAGRKRAFGSGCLPAPPIPVLDADAELNGDPSQASRRVDRHGDLREAQQQVRAVVSVADDRAPCGSSRRRSIGTAPEACVRGLRRAATPGGHGAASGRPASGRLRSGEPVREVVFKALFRTVLLEISM